MKPESDANGDSAALTPLLVQTERDLRANIRQICRRLDAQPALSRLLFINPVLVLEDVGVELSPAVREHIMQALRFPPKRRERIAALEAEVSALADTYAREPADTASESAEQAALQAPLHELLAAKHAELARLRQGAMVFFPRSTYEQFKRGEKKHRWIKAVRFGV
jgi:hypothetical protein